jgi:hypothetical protein
MTTTITIQNFGTYTVPTEIVYDILNIIQSSKVVNPRQETNEVLSSHTENDGRTLING